MLTGACKAGEQDREARGEEDEEAGTRQTGGKRGGGADREKEVRRGRGGEEHRGGHAAPL